MKQYRSVRARAEEMNYKKGVNRLDVNSGGYKAGKIVYYIAFIWVVLFQAAYLFANTAAFGTLAASKVVIALYITFWCSTAGVVAGFFLLKYKLHLASFLVSLVACVGVIIMLGRNDNVSLAFLEGGFMNNKHFWFYYAPAYLLLALLAFVCFVGVKSWFHGRNDYKAALATMYRKYQEEHPEVSDIEWQQHLRELDAKMEAPKKEKKRKK
jgi:hypothetical protein